MTRFLLCTILLFSLTACSSSEDTLSLTKGSTFWSTYINRPVIVKITKPEKLDSRETALAKRLAPLDSQIVGLEHMLDSISNPSNEEQVMRVMEAYPWVTAIYLLDQNGITLAKIPTQTQKVVNFSYLKERDTQPRNIYSNIFETPQGNEVLLARPYVQDGVIVGFIGVSFEMPVLLAYVDLYNKDSKKLIILSPDTLIWSNDIYYSDSGLPDLNDGTWQKMVDKNSMGLIDANGNKKAWAVRYLGDLPLIFIVPDTFE